MMARLARNNVLRSLLPLPHSDCRFVGRRVRLACGFLLAAPALSAAVGKAAHIVIVADTRRFTGWKAWCAGLYNDSHLAFALLTILIVPTVGLLLGKITSLAMARLGINLKSRELAED